MLPEYLASFFSILPKIYGQKLNLKKAIKYLILFLNILTITALLISYLSVYVPPDKFWIPSFFGLAFPFIVLANILFLVFWVFFKSKFLLLSLIPMLAGWGFVNRYIQFSGNNTEKEGIKIVSYNVQNFPGKKEADQKATANRILEFLDEKNADIICLQEIKLRQKRIFNIADVVNQLKSIKHYHYASNGATFGLATFTSYPIIKMGEIRYQKLPNMAIFTDVLIGPDTVRIFNVHLQSYQIDPRKYDIIDSPGIDEKKDIREIREIGGKLKRAFHTRAGQVREIRQVIDETPYPVIICGDFNDTPVSYTYQLLRGDFNDAFVESGKGFVRTYIGKLPSYRIDNIFYSDDFDAYNFQSENFRASDHLPVTCLLIKK